MAEPVKNNRSMRLNYKYNRRKTTLMRKANQLSKLCDVKVCMVCFGPDKTVETWPKNKSEVCDIISKYKLGGLGNNMGRGKKHDLVGFLENKKKKLEEKSNKKIMKNLVGGCVYSTWDERLDRFSEEELVGLCGCLDSKLQNLRDEINSKKKKKKNQEALVVNSPPDNNNNNIDHNLNMFNNVYQSNPITPPQPLWFSGDCSSYNQQAFSGSDALLGRANIDHNLNMLTTLTRAIQLHHHILSGSVVIAARIINKLLRVPTPFLEELRILVFTAKIMGIIIRVAI
ncbi:hypothetical protein EZV62_004035 [Acer yangbiense]|uniref:MADS-box domain-containing protein n=1 Tax=Acer yangbiense TaxID=1000413 RepID=A0A5C7IIJ5_9ROSI|nr:hypothetical protein EZV62_004035 [Acer yangbiense]